MNLSTGIIFFILVGCILAETVKLYDRPKNEHVNAFFQKCGAVCNVKFCNTSYTCRPVNRTSKLKKLDIYFHVKLEAPIDLRIRTYKKFNTQYRPHMIDTKMEFCQQLLLKSHPILAFFEPPNPNHTMFRPCPISGHRYVGPLYTSTWIGHLIPVGEWKLDFIVTKSINGSDEHICTVSDYYLVKPTGATEF